MLITLGNHVNERTVNLNNCGANQEVTFELNGQTYTTVTSDADGLAVAKLYDDGEYTVRTGYQSQSKTLIVDDDTENYDLSKWIFFLLKSTVLYQFMRGCAYLGIPH